MNAPRPSNVLPPGDGHLVVVDTEGSGLYVDDGARPSMVQVALSPTEAWSFPFDQGPSGKVEQLTLLDDPNLDELEWCYLTEWLSRQRLVMHNAKHDLHQLKAAPPGWAVHGRDLSDALEWDTMVAASVLDPTERVGLGAIAARLGLESKDNSQVASWLKKNKHHKYRYDLVPYGVMEPYSTGDVKLTYQVWEHQQAQLEAGEGSRAEVERELEYTKVLWRIESRGLPLDASAMLDACAVLQAKVEELEKDLPFPNSAAGAKAWFYDKHGYEPPTLTESGKPSVDAEAMRLLANQNAPGAALYAEIAQIQTALKMWYQPWPSMVGSDGRIRTSYRQTSVVSGRTSNERVNLQAIPHGNRVVDGVPTPRDLIYGDLWECDLAQAELRVAAKYARAKRMQELVLSDVDTHGQTATDLFDCTEDDSDWFVKRQVAKRCNFALIFGVGAKTMRDQLRRHLGLEWTEGEVGDLISRWRAIHPEFQRAIRATEKDADRDHYVKLVNGRRRWFRQGEFTHKAFNQKVQSSLAELAKEWAMETERRWPGVLILTIHDSEVLETKDETVPQAVADLGAQLGTAWFDFPMAVDVGRWGEH